MSTLNIIITILLFTPLTLWATGGSSGTGGGDRTNWDTDAAWFIGADRSIKICTQVSPDFGFSQEKINAGIRDVFKVWENYAQQRKIEYSNDYKNQLLPVNERISFKIEILPNCDGGENLKLYLGVTTPEVDQAKIKYVNSVGIAERISFNSVDGFGKGFIWIGKLDWDSWEKTNHENLFLRFIGILSHELGHVFGCDHVAGTIMDKDIHFYLSSSSRDLLQKVYSIDYNRQLKPCFKCWSEFTGVRKKVTSLGVLPEVFNIITGRVAGGVSRIKLVKETQDKYYLELSDDQEHLRLSIRFNGSINSLENTGTSIFYVDHAESAPGSFSERMYRRAGGYIGYQQAQILKPKIKNSPNSQEEWLPMMMIFNEDSVVKATVMVNDISYVLFKSAPKPENSLNK